MKEMCAYCAKWFPIEEMKQLPDDYRSRYCPKCYPEVLETHWKLPPWNRKIFRRNYNESKVQRRQHIWTRFS